MVLEVIVDESVAMGERIAHRDVKEWSSCVTSATAHGNDCTYHARTEITENKGDVFEDLYL